MRVFSAFPNVAQNTQNISITHGTVTFKAGNGAGSVAFCPKISPCGGFTQATVPGGQGFLGVIAGPNTFGGVFRLLQHFKAGSGAWFVKNPGATPTKTLGFNPRTRGVTGTPGGGTTNTPNAPWEAGLTNALASNYRGPASKIYTGFLGPNGAIQTLGDFVGTLTFRPPTGFATMFKMTTGTIIGSDATPPTSMGGPFTFSTQGYDDRDASGNGNIQLVGGGILYGGLSGNVFNRITRLRMAVPEPIGPAVLAAGLVGLGVVARIRRKRSSL
jgi:hypothetical protein